MAGRKDRPFATDRTRKWRGADLSPTQQTTISNVEKFGCEVVSVPKSETGPGWAYTVGAVETGCKYEIITVGLLQKTAHHLLNTAVDLQ